MASGTALWVFLVILAGAAALRFWGLPWGFPLQRAHVDEYVTVFYSLHFFQQGISHPHFFDYPALYLHTVWIAVAVLRFFSGSPSLTLAGFLEGKSVLPLLVGRGLSAVLALAALWLLWRAGRAWKNNRMALWAALFLALHPVHVQMSHYAMPDVLSATLTAAALLCWVLFMRRDSETWALAAGAFLGLAAASKYSPGFLAVGFMLWLAWQRRWKLAGLFAGACAAGFFIGSPMTFLAWREFLPRIHHLFSSHVLGGGQGPGVLQRFLRSLVWMPLALHPALLILAVLGFWSERTALARSFLWAAFCYFLGVGAWTTQNLHYYLPLVPLACLGAGLGMDGFVRQARLGWAVGAVVALLLAWPTGRFLFLISQPDTRLVALEWMRSHLPPGANILRFPHTPEFFPTDPFHVKVDWEGRRLPDPPEQLLREYDYVLTSSFQARPSPEETAWEAAAQEILTVSHPAPFFPHHPRIRLWGRKSLALKKVPRFRPEEKQPNPS